MSKLYERVNWEDYPSTATPITADTLNKMDNGIDIVDTRLDELEEDYNNAKENFESIESKSNTALSNSENALNVTDNLVKSITFNANTGDFTITLGNDSTSKINITSFVNANGGGDGSGGSSITTSYLENKAVTLEKLDDLLQSYVNDFLSLRTTYQGTGYNSVKESIDSQMEDIYEKLNQSNVNNFAYKPGDVVEIRNFVGAGYVTSAGTQVSFVIPLTKSLDNVNSVSVDFSPSNFSGGLTLRQDFTGSSSSTNKGYTHGSTASTRVKPASSYISIAPYGIGMSLKFASTANVSNNNAIGINCSCVLTFS